MTRSLVELLGGAFAAVSITGCLVIPLGTGGGGRVVIQGEAPVVSGPATVAAFAARLAPRLASALDQLVTRRRGLPPETSPTFPVEARQLVEEGRAQVLELLADAELTASLAAGAEELAPLRDYVRNEAATALAELSEPRLGFRPPAGLAPAVERGLRADVRRVQRTDRPGGAGSVDRYLAALVKLGRRVERSDLQTTFCAISRPTGGRFMLVPESAPDRESVTRAVGTLGNLWRGSYRYQVEIGDLSHEATNLDLMSPEQLTLECVVAGRSIACRPFTELRAGCVVATAPRQLSPTSTSSLR